MSADSSVIPGTVDWTGENPGILLKDAEGAFSAMALFFRVAWSPVGTGQLLLLYGTPGSEFAETGAPNFLMGDNSELSDFLMLNFIGKLAAFRDAPPFKNLTYHHATTIRSSGDPLGRRYAESVANADYCVELAWEELEHPRVLELSPEQTGTKEHKMSTLLIPAKVGRIFVNGRELPGAVGTRVQAGMETTTAFLYFAETWVIPPSDLA